MAVSVRLNVVKPESPGLQKLLIYESDSRTGSYTLIETVEEIGEYPDYISYYTTDKATSQDDWFVIEWEDDKGARSLRSNPIQGNTKTAPGEVAGRVLIRDPSIDELIAVQEAEVVIEDYFLKDSYTVDVDTVTHKEWAGLTYLVMARVYLTEIIVGSNVQGYTAGIVAQQPSNPTKMLDNVKKLIDEGNKMLNRNFSVVAMMEDIEIAGGVSGATTDQSRLLVELL